LSLSFHGVVLIRPASICSWSSRPCSTTSAFSRTPCAALR